MKATIFFLGIMLILGSCQRDKLNKENKLKELKIGNILIYCPGDFNFLNSQGVDSYTTMLIDSKKDTFRLELGKRGIIYSLYSPPTQVLPPSQMDRVTKIYGRKPTADEAVFSDFWKEDFDSRIFEDNYFMYDTANNIIMKIEQPKRIGKGITGVYIPVLKDSNSFSMYATNLDSTSHMMALKMFHSIRYK